MGTFTRLLGFLRPYRSAVTLSMGFAIAAMVGTVALPYLTGRAIDEIEQSSRAGLETIALAIVVAGVARLGLTVARRLIAGRVSLGVEYDLRTLLYERLQQLEMAFFDHSQTGQLMSRATVDLQAVRFFLGYGLIFMVQAALTLALGAAAMIVLDPGLALLALSPVPFVVAAAARYGRKARPALQDVQQRIAELTAEAEENVSGVRVVKAFAREEAQLERFRGRVAGVFRESMRSTSLRALYNPMIAFLPTLGLAAILLVGGRRVVSGDLTLGEFAAFYAYLLLLLGPMRTLGVMLSASQRATASGARIFELLDRAPRVVAPENPRELPAGPGRVELRAVDFRYEEAGSPVLRGVDLDVAGGMTVALVGATASGKSTLVALLSRLYDVDEGAVLIDGVDVRELDPHALRRQVAVVSGDPFLFSATVAENVAYARPGASRQEIEAATRAAQAHDFVSRLPEGYDTRVGERGLTLSGGQRQRLAIARALLADPRILVLDDATSSVDASTERELQRALDAAAAGRTTFVIAHRRSTLASADEVVVLAEGAIVARGTHASLLETSEHYREIVELGLPDEVFLNRRPTDMAAGL